MGGAPGLPAGVQSVVVSHESRRGVRGETLAHLDEQGFVPLVEETNGEPAAWKVRIGAKEALQRVRPWGRGVLYLEDDIRFRVDWRPLLDLVVAADHPTVCCSLELQTIPRPWADRIRNRKPRERVTVKPRVVPMARSITYYGTQCVYLPAWSLELLWDDPRLHDRSKAREGMAFDGLLNNHMQDRPAPLTMNVVIPDLAEHLCPPAVKHPKRAKRVAWMFDWEAEWTPTSTPAT